MSIEILNVSSGDCGSSCAGSTFAGRDVSFGRKYHWRYGKDKKPTAEYKTWCSMKERCSNTAARSYSRYGGRGITVCDEWVNDFDAFIICVGHRPKGRSLDRIDNNKGYCPGNVRWATAEQQANNTSTNRYIEWRGERLTLTQWSRRLGFDPGTLRERLKRRWDVETAFTTRRRRRIKTFTHDHHD